MAKMKTEAPQRGLLSQLVATDHYYVYIHPLFTVPVPHCLVENLEFHCIDLPITLAEYERLAHTNPDPRMWQEIIDSQDSTSPHTHVFMTLSKGTLVNVTGMTVTRTDSVYSHIREFWPSFEDDNATLYAGYSETAPAFRRKGVYTWVHGTIFTWARDNGYRRVVLLEGKDQPGPRSSQDKLGSKVVTETCHITLFSGLRSKYRLHHWVTNPRMVQFLATRVHQL